MRVVVCAKQIPDPEQPGALDPASRTLVREGAPVIDDADTYSVEIALRLVAEAGGGEVILVSMVPDAATSGLRTALAMGADQAIVVSDPALFGSDALSTAKVLAAVVRRVEPDLVLTATESTDGYTGTVPVQLAELLDLPAATFAKHVELRDGGLAVQRQTADGVEEIECPLPAVVSVTAGVVEVRYPSFKGIMSAKSKPVSELDLAELGIDPHEVGWAGARQEVVATRHVDDERSGEVIVDDGSAHERVVALLQSLKLI